VADRSVEEGQFERNCQAICGLSFPQGFYETAGIVKVFVFAFVFSFLAFLLLLLFFVRVLKIHLGLLYALEVSSCVLGA
jgi:hypothetical protein